MDFSKGMFKKNESPGNLNGARFVFFFLKKYPYILIIVSSYSEFRLESTSKKKEYKKVLSSGIND